MGKKELIRHFNEKSEKALKTTKDEEKRRRVRAVRDFAVREVEKLPE